MMSASEARASKDTRPVTVDEMDAEIKRTVEHAIFTGVSSSDFNRRPLGEDTTAELQRLGYMVELRSDGTWSVRW